jgi:hypothetical protein
LKKSNLLFGSLLLAFTLVGCGDGDDDDNKVVHNQGVNCLECHSSGKRSFDSGATVYTVINGANYDASKSAKNYTIRLLLEDGKHIVYSKGNGQGNARWRGDEGAINNFTAQVLNPNGKVVNQSSKNSHNVGRLACNGCHTQSGLNGAPGRIVNYDYSGSLASKLIK